MTYEPKTYDEIKEEIVVNVVQNVDSIVDVNEGSVLDVFISAFSTEFENVYDDISDMDASLRVSTATGEDLDEIGEAAGISRIEGEQATCEVSFIRNSSSSVSFTIPQSTQVSTNPNGDTVYTFTTNEPITWETSVSSLSVNYYNGVVYYKVDNRKLESLTISGYTLDSDFELEEDYSDELIDNSTYELLDACNATTDWTVVGDAAAITNNEVYYQRASKSLNLLKTATTSKFFGYDKTLSSTYDIENKSLFVHYRIDDATVQGDITKISFMYGSSATNYYQFDYDGADLEVGGSSGSLPRLKLDYTEATVVGNPDIENIDYLKVYIEMSDASDTVAAGDILIDFWFAATSDDYRGDVIKWLTTTTSDDVLTVGYTPLSYEVDCTATAIGSDGNVAIGEVNYKVSSLAQVDTVYNYVAGEDGSDEETDFDYRDRIKSAADLRGSATARAIEAAVEELSYVKDCVVIDTPEESITGEKHTYDATAESFRLNYEQALDNTSLAISGYTKDTDFQLNTSTNEIEFGLGGTDPADNDVLEVDYDCERVGKIKAIVTGETGALTTGQKINVNTTIEENISAGINYTVSDPTYTSTDLDVTINVDEDYNSTDVKTAVEQLCTSIFNSLEIGETLKIYRIISTISFMPGVINVSSVQLNAGTSDVTADEDEILTEGTVTITVA